MTNFFEKSDLSDNKNISNYFDIIFEMREWIRS